MGVTSVPEQNCYALYFQRGDEEICGVKIQPPDMPGSECQKLMAMNRILIAAALPLYLASGFTGLMLPCAYLREKVADEVEAGIALFPIPDPEGKEAQGADSWRIDGQFGKGASAMVSAMFEGLSAFGEGGGVQLYTVIDLDVRTRRALGSTAFDTMVIGPEVFSLKLTVEEDDPWWRFLMERGIHQAWHLPSVPGAYPGSTVET